MGATSNFVKVFSTIRDVGATVLPIAGTFMQIKGARIQQRGFETIAQGQVLAGKLEADAQIYNATIAKQEARLVERSKILETKALIKRKEAFLSTQRAAFSKAGVLFEGSPMEVMQETETEFEKDILINVYNRNVEKNRFLSEARIREREARIAEQFGLFRARQTLLTGRVQTQARIAQALQTLI